MIELQKQIMDAIKTNDKPLRIFSLRKAIGYNGDLFLLKSAVITLAEDGLIGISEIQAKRGSIWSLPILEFSRL